MILNYDEIDSAEYHRHPALSVTTAKELLKPGGPEKVHWSMKHGRAASRVFDLGHATDIPDRPRCRTCRDSGEVMHPAWGSRTCPEPTIPCPDCTAGGW